MTEFLIADFRLPSRKLQIENRKSFGICLDEV